MDTGHNDLLGELASDAALERSDFIVQATEQLRRFLDHHKDRIAVLGGLTLIDDTRLSLGPASEVRLERYVYAPSEGGFAMVLKFARGVAA